MISRRTKDIANDIRSRFRKDGVSNRNISVVCKETKDKGRSIETIYVIVTIPNTAVDKYAEPIVKEFIRKYKSDDLGFMFLKASETFGDKIL